MSKNSDKKTQSTTEIMRELDDIVAWFESGEADIDTSLEKFEKGMQLAQEAKSRLSDVENKVRKLQADFDKSDS